MQRLFQQVSVTTFNKTSVNMLWVRLAAPPVIDRTQPCVPVNLDLQGIELMGCVQC